jgi:hypothetical protein
VAHEADSLDARLPGPLLSALLAAAARLDAADVPWALAGSSARALLGSTRVPRDIDIEVAARDADRAGAALGCALVQEDTPTWSSVRGYCRIGDVEIDICAGVVVAGADWALEPDDALAETWSHIVEVGGTTIRVAPPEELLVRAIVAGDWNRLAKLADGGGAPPRPAYLFRRLASARALR